MQIMNLRNFTQNFTNEVQWRRTWSTIKNQWEKKRERETCTNATEYKTIEDEMS